MVALNIRRHSLGQRLKGNPKFSMGYILIQRAKGRLSPLYIIPFEILHVVSEVAYELAIPPDFAAVYPIFHVFMLRKYIPDPSHVLRWDSIYPDDQLTFVEETVLVLASDMRQLHTREILVVKIQWRHRPVEEDTWEIESETWSQYPHLFETSEKYVDDMMMPGEFERVWDTVMGSCLIFSCVLFGGMVRRDEFFILLSFMYFLAVWDVVGQTQVLVAAVELVRVRLSGDRLIVLLFLFFKLLSNEIHNSFIVKLLKCSIFFVLLLNIFEKFLNKQARSGRLTRKKIKSLEEIIRIAANNAKDVVDLKIFHIIKDTSAMKKSMQREDLLQVVEKMDATKIEVMTIVSELSASINDIVDDEIVEVSMLPNLEDVVVRGLDDDLELIVERLRGRQSDLDIVTISGMGGIGKTTLARKTHDHLSIRYHFDLRVWVTISQEYRSRNVLLDALHCISKQPNSFIGEDYDKKDDNELADLVQKKLKGRRYLVVVDDIWSTGDWDRIRRIFPDCNNRSRVLLTTRDTEVAMYLDSNSPHHMTLLNLDNSWKLLCDKVFGPEHDHPPELEEIGKRIAEKCQGLPLTISVIGGYLSKMTRTLESWKYVAQTLSEIIASHPDKCLGLLGLSYHHLPNHLKPCFLSMSSFPEDFQFETCILIQLWIAEDFISAFGSSKSLEEVAEDYLEDLISRNLIMVRKRRFNGEIKSCGIHDLLREFCLNEAEMTNFMHVKSTNPTLPTPKHNVCRFNFQTQTHLVEDCCKQLPPTARSIYLFCDYIFSKRWSSVKLEVFSRFNLLRVLAIFHEDVSPPPFPLAITKLFHLTYLSIRCRGKLPASMAALQNLQTLVMDGFNIILPGKIWMTKKLRHIHVGGYYSFPSRRRETIRNIHLPIDLPNLVELSRPYYSNCTNEVFSAIPNLKRLNVYVSCMRKKYRLDNHLIDMSSLRKLKALKCFSNGMYQHFYWQPLSMKRFVFPLSLKRLSFSKCRFPWEDISTLAMLPNLEEL
ncbi:putative deacetylvindoline O-acetyltransferase-like [Capsicum annuum]|nr:putative deacetylvindoline O-acetyltransferase-like [Capsicum annuum]